MHLFRVLFDIELRTKSPQTHDVHGHVHVRVCTVCPCVLSTRYAAPSDAALTCDVAALTSSMWP